MNTETLKTSLGDIQLQLEQSLQPSEFVDILKRSTLAERRPVEDEATIRGMLANADIVATARTHEKKLVGVARAITDYHYCTYLSDLAVDASYQQQGVGKRLTQFTHEQAGLNTTLVLLAAPAAADYYRHIGMTQHDSCWIVRRQ